MWFYISTLEFSLYLAFNWLQSETYRQKGIPLIRLLLFAWNCWTLLCWEYKHESHVKRVKCELVSVCHSTIEWLNIYFGTIRLLLYEYCSDIRGQFNESGTFAMSGNKLQIATKWDQKKSKILHYKKLTTHRNNHLISKKVYPLVCCYHARV